MKQIITLFLLLTVTSIFAQQNKPDSSAWAITAGNRIIGGGSTLNISRVTKAGWEFGLGASFNNYSSSNSNSSPINVADTANASLSAIATTSYKNSTFTFNLFPFLIKHIATKNNIDPYIGISVMTGFITRSSNNFETEYLATNYVSKRINTDKLPMQINVGINATFGLRYFIAKNLAIGVESSIGISNTYANGKRIVTNQRIETGALNPNTIYNETSATTIEYDYLDTRKNIYNNSSSLHITYYFGK